MGGVMQRVLIINADDFGLSPGINYGIIDAHRRGVVTSTTAMMTADAMNMLRRCVLMFLHWRSGCTLF